jgi:hypothetical protein
MTGTVFTSKCTTYTVVYSVTNPAQITAKKNQTVIVDCGAPEMTLLGDNPMMLAVGAVYTEPSATAFDNIDGTLTSRIVITGTVNTQQEGTDTVTYTVSDRAGNKTTEKRAVIVYKPAVVDSVPPVITLIGDNPMNLALNAPYIELGASARDNIDGDIPSAKITKTGTVTTSVVGTYHVTYNVSDNAGNAAIPKTRTIIVTNTTGPDVTKPVIILKGKVPDSVKVGPGNYVDPGDTAIDDRDGDVTGKVVVTELYGSTLPISLGSPGVYTLVYTVSDKAGNKAEVTRVVYVVGVSLDLTPPVITLIGAASCTVMVKIPYTDPGAKAMDDVDKDISSKIKAVLTTAAGAAALMTTFTNTEGSYKITYRVSDAAGNAATEKIRNILVRDTTGFGTNLTVKYGVPLTTALPTVSTSSGGDVTYGAISTDGVGAPSMAAVKTFTIKWRNETTSQGLDNFAFSFTSGNYISLKDNNRMTNTFAQVKPGFTLTGSTVDGLDGSYYIKASTAQCVWVKTDGSFAIIFKP